METRLYVCLCVCCCERMNVLCLVPSSLTPLTQNNTVYLVVCCVMITDFLVITSQHSCVISLVTQPEVKRKTTASMDHARWLTLLRESTSSWISVPLCFLLLIINSPDTSHAPWCRFTFPNPLFQHDSKQDWCAQQRRHRFLWSDSTLVWVWGSMCSGSFPFELSILNQRTCNVPCRCGALQGTVEGHVCVWTFPLQLTVDREPSPFLDTFGGVVICWPIGEIFGAKKPVHISVWVDMVEGTGGTITC